MGMDMVMHQAFRGSKATPASWVTLGPQIGMKPCAERPKPSRIVSAMARFLSTVHIVKVNTEHQGPVGAPAPTPALKVRAGGPHQTGTKLNPKSRALHLY